MFEVFSEEGKRKPGGEKVKEVNPLYSEHLAEGVRPIMASIVDSHHRDDQSTDAMLSIMGQGENIDYFWLPENSRDTMISPDKRTYIISGCDDKDKFSQNYIDCTGVVLVGTQRDTKKQISFLSHQDPKVILGKYQDQFRRDLSKRINELKELSTHNSIDAVIFGGQDIWFKKYKESIKLLSEICQKVLGFEPVVLVGPNTRILKGDTDIYLDTQNRRVYLDRPEQRKDSNQSYLPSQYDLARQKWKKKLADYIEEAKEDLKTDDEKGI